MENTYKFFCNSGCAYLPCHKAANASAGKSGFNCLFCYCPLYSLGDKCGGNFKYSGEKKVKNCEDCELPHIPEYYEIITAKLAPS